MEHDEQDIDEAKHSEDSELGFFDGRQRPGHGLRYLKDATPGQRKAALVAALLFIVLLLASIALFFAVEMELLRPTPTTIAESRYVRARDAAAEAVAAAEAAGLPVDSHPSVISARLAVVDAQIQLGQLNAASRTVQLIIRHNPDNIHALLLQGALYELSGDYEEAIDAYQRVLEKLSNSDPESQREALRGMGNSFLALEQNLEALDALSRAAAIPPASITLHIAAGELALDLERWQDAATHFYIVLFFYSDNQIALGHLAMLERDHGDAAQAALEALIDGDSNLGQEAP